MPRTADQIAQGEISKPDRIYVGTGTMGTAIGIALAYVLNLPFPTFPIIGPLLPEETRTSLAALDVALSPADIRWLNLED